MLTSVKKMACPRVRTVVTLIFLDLVYPNSASFLLQIALFIDVVVLAHFLPLLLKKWSTPARLLT